jgi:hypothetical protein
MKSYSKYDGNFKKSRFTNVQKLKGIMVNVSVWFHKQLARIPGHACVEMPILVGLISRFVGEYTNQPFHGAEVLAA